MVSLSRFLGLQAWESFVPHGMESFREKEVSSFGKRGSFGFDEGFRKEVGFGFMGSVTW